MGDYLSLLVNLTNAFQNLTLLQARHQVELTEAFKPNKNQVEIPQVIFQESIENLKQQQAEQVIQQKEGIYYLLDAALQYACNFIDNIKGSETEKNLEMRKLEDMVKVFSQYEQDLEAFHKTKMPYTPVKKIFSAFFSKPMQTAMGARITPYYFGLFPSLRTEPYQRKDHSNVSSGSRPRLSPNAAEID